jgi:opacity protein-like surface antigen
MFGQTLRRAAVALLLAVVGAGAAGAQTYDGSGLIKFGAFAQGAFLNVDQTLPVEASSSPSGFTGGFSAGYDLRLRDRFLVGLEVDGSFGDARDSAGITDFGFDYLLTARARLGAYVLPHWLIYGTAGVGFLGMEAHNPGITAKAEETLTGYVVGAGTEIDWHHVILFGEYLYGDFGDRRFTLPDPPLSIITRHEASIEAHLVRLGIKFKVGHDYAHDFDHPDHYKRRDSLK